jgi:hypothetical protein
LKYIVTSITAIAQSASSVESTTATLNGSAIIGAENITQRGFAWSTTDNSTTPGLGQAPPANFSDNATVSGNWGTGAFTNNNTGLSSGTTYYYRAYVYDSTGWTWSTEHPSFLTKPAAATSVAATENDGAKVVITWTKATGATGYHVYRDVTEIASSPFGDVATADDAGGTAPLITAGSAVASDGTSLVQVNLSLSGTSVANGTTYTYKVVSQNGSGHGADSTTDTGYRLATALTYQWNRSAADSDASYSTLGGFTSSTGADTTAPSNGDGRYYTCTLVSTNASNTPATATANRGYRTIPTYDITNDPASKAFGTVAASSTYYAKGSAPSNPVSDGECTFTLTNTGNVAINVSIKGANFTGGAGWTLASSVGTDNVTITAYYSGQNPASGVVLTTSDQSFISNLAASATKKWDFKFMTGTFTDGAAKSSAITLTSVAY